MTDPALSDPLATVSRPPEGAPPFPLPSLALERTKAVHVALWERYKRLLVARQFEPWATLWCHDARFEMLHDGAQPTAVAHGRERILKAFHRASTRYGRLRIKDVTLHQMQDPAVFIVSYQLETRDTERGRVVGSSVARVRTRDGRIAEFIESVDAFSHAAFIDALEEAA